MRGAFMCDFAGAGVRIRASRGRLGFDGDTEPCGACRVVGPVKSWHLHIIANDDVELAYAA